MQSFAIIPAAGHSRRMGRPKLLLPWNGATVMDRVLDAWQASRVDRIVVVVRPGDTALERLCRARRIEVVVPARAPPEMSDSVRAGLRRVAAEFHPQTDDVWLLAPADMPRFLPSTIDRLLDSHDAESPEILVPEFEGRRGHPVLFPWPLAAEVETLSRTEGIRDLLQRHSTRRIACRDANVLEDVDTPEDYDRLRPD